MTRRFSLAVLALCAFPLVAAAQVGPPQDRYIVVLNEGLDLPENVAADIAIQTGGRVGYVYEHALSGFSITMPRAALAGVQGDPRVDYVEEDKPVRAFEIPPAPTGIQRIFADENANIGIDGNDDWRVDADVAVLDTGIDVDHPDLYVVGGANCLSHTGGPPFSRTYVCDETESYDDGHSHGTHVAGTVGAIDDGANTDDGIHVVGVAPGVRLWAVKVLDDNGSGSFGSIIAGIDWVAEKEGTDNPIEVINMSLGGSGQSDSVDAAIDGAVNDHGVTVVVAAGNDGDDAEGYTPANSPEAFTISALADYNGEPDGKASWTCLEDEDDTLAWFSNWDNDGHIIQMTAPGVCILSTVPIEDGDYDIFSGTSMASPHAAGAAALLASTHDYGSDRNGADVDTIRDTLIVEGNSNWVDDSNDGIREPLLDVSNTNIFAPASTTEGDSGDGGDTNSAPTASFTASCTDLTCDFDGSGSKDSDGSISSYAWDFGDDTTGTGETVNKTYESGGTYTVTLTVTDDDDATDSESQSVSVSDGTGDTNDIYVWAIEMSHKDYGPGGSFKDLETTIYIKRDSDGDGDAESSDDWAGSADVTVEFTQPDGQVVTLSVQTDSQGSGTIIRKRVEKGEHTATVTDVTHDTYTYDSSLSVTSKSHHVD